MRAVILAGGKGARLRPYTTVIPKPLIPLGERPILEILIGQLARTGVERIDLCVGHLGRLIETYFADSRTLPGSIDLRYHWEAEPLGTAGALAQIDDLDEPFLTLNGDILTNLDYAHLMRSHTERGGALTIATHTKKTQLELGVIEEEGGEVTAYIEKPKFSHTVSMGIYAYDPSVLDHIHHDRLDFPDVVRTLLDAGQRVTTYAFDGEWFDIGTVEELARAHEFLESNPRVFNLG